MNWWIFDCPKCGKVMRMPQSHKCLHCNSELVKVRPATEQEVKAHYKQFDDYIKDDGDGEVTKRVLEKRGITCSHDRLNMDGYCFQCGADCRG